MNIMTSLKIYNNYCFDSFRNFFLDKGENVSDVTNWRPTSISISFVVRRVYEKILDKYLKEHISFNCINTNVMNIILNYAKRKKILNIHS